MASKTNWAEAIQPLLKKYKTKQHPLEYKSRYQLMVMVILSAQDSDRNINNIAPALFNAFPDIESLSRATPDALFPFISKVRNFVNKTKWLIEMSHKTTRNSLCILPYRSLCTLHWD